MNFNPGISVLSKYGFSDSGKDLLFKKLGEIYPVLNRQINLISRKDMEHFYIRHVLHSLAIARFIRFLPGSKVLDVGTGGGFPGIPLAIEFPEVHFHLTDSIGKKIKAVQYVVDELGLRNVTAEQIRVEKHKGKYDFVVSRAVAHMEKFYPWVKNKFKSENKHSISNGILYLKGGDLREELQKFPHAQVIPLNRFFEEAFFETKKLVYLPQNIEK